MPAASDPRCVKLVVSRFARPRSPTVRRPVVRPMSLQALRRWIARHPLSWVLGLALALGGAQFAATAHEYTHVASAAASHGDLHAASPHDCPTCLLAAALGGAAPAPSAILLITPLAAAPIGADAEHRFIPRVTLAYASRAPPAQPVLAA